MNTYVRNEEGDGRNIILGMGRLYNRYPFRVSDSVPYGPCRAVETDPESFHLITPLQHEAAQCTHDNMCRNRKESMHLYHKDCDAESSKRLGIGHVLKCLMQPCIAEVGT